MMNIISKKYYYLFFYDIKFVFNFYRKLKWTFSGEAMA